MSARETLFGFVQAGAEEDDLPTFAAAVDAHRDEVRTEGARILEDAACDADWTQTPDYCAGLRAGAELLLANTGEKVTAAAATATPDFFQPGRTYAREHHAATIRFLVRYVDASPCGTYRIAFGWRIEDGDVTWSPSDSDDIGGWVDVTKAGDGRD